MMHLRILKSDALPVTKYDGEEAHAVRTLGAPNVIVLSPQAYSVYRKYKEAPDQVSQEDYAFLNLVLDQVQLQHA